MSRSARLLPLSLGLALALGSLVSAGVAASPKVAARGEGTIVFAGAPDYPERMHIWTISPEGTSLRRLTTGNVDDGQPAWSRDARRIAFVSDRDTPPTPYCGQPQCPTLFDLYVVGADGTGLRRVTRTSFARGGEPSWSPDGRRLAYSFDGHIHVIGLDGRGDTDLTQSTKDDNHWPAWSPNGKTIAFVAGRLGGRDRICLMRPDGSRRRCFAHPAYDDVTPSWSPDGTKLLFESAPWGTGGTGIWMMSADGTKKTPLEPFRFGAKPVWSPDGASLVFVIGPQPAFPVSATNLYIGALATGKRRQLTHFKLEAVSPDWAAPPGR